jgi:hypothetical protein
MRAKGAFPAASSRLSDQPSAQLIAYHAGGPNEYASSRTTPSQPGSASRDRSSISRRNVFCAYRLAPAAALTATIVPSSARHRIKSQSALVRSTSTTSNAPNRWRASADRGAESEERLAIGNCAIIYLVHGKKLTI